MKRRAPDYDQLSSTYDTRYGGSRLDGIAEALLKASHQVSARTILEVGCGTGRWLTTLRNTGATVVGVDASTGMLTRAAKTLGSGDLAAARANQLPFTGRTFDMVCCVNALHHFDDPRAFIAQAGALLLPNGILAVVAIDPRTIRHRYHYDFFDGALEMDLRRYPSFGQLVDWTWEAGLEQVQLTVVETARRQFHGDEVLRDPFLEKESDSTLALLSEQSYIAGVRRITSALAASRASTEPLLFRSEMSFCMVTGQCGLASDAAKHRLTLSRL